MPLTKTTLNLSLASTQTNPLDLGTASFPLKYAKSMALAAGSGTGQADRIFTDTRTLAASATENLDLAGSLTDAFGATITFARIKLVLVTAAVANTNNVNVIRESTNGVPLFLALADGIPVRPGGGFAWWAPDATAVAVTASTGDLLTVTNSAAGTSVTYDIVVIGASV
jgi:hypothetical protein